MSIQKIPNDFISINDLSIQKAAAMYCELGFRILPVTANKKTPAVKNWPSEASSDYEKYAEYWTNDFNIGLATGVETGIAAIDVDVKGDKPGTESLDVIEAKLGSFESLTSTTHLVENTSSFVLRDNTSKTK